MWRGRIVSQPVCGSDLRGLGRSLASSLHRTAREPSFHHPRRPEISGGCRIRGARETPPPPPTSGLPRPSRADRVRGGRDLPPTSASGPRHSADSGWRSWELVASHRPSRVVRARPALSPGPSPVDLTDSPGLFPACGGPRRARSWTAQSIARGAAPRVQGIRPGRESSGSRGPSGRRCPPQATGWHARRGVAAPAEPSRR